VVSLERWLARSVAGTGGAVLSVLHDLNLAAAYADRVVLLAHGRLVALGPPGAVLTAERLTEVFGIPFLVATHPALDHPLLVPQPLVGEAGTGVPVPAGRG
jgi:iron complex transport system ATP-binding protein